MDYAMKFTSHTNIIYHILIYHVEVEWVEFNIVI